MKIQPAAQLSLSDWRKMRKLCLVLLAILGAVALLYLANLQFLNCDVGRYQNSLPSSEKWRPFLEGVDFAKRVTPEFDRFIYTGVMNGRLGNQLYRFASLYAIGQELGRSPAFVYNEDIIREMDDELADTFPELHKRVYFLKPNIQGQDKVKFAKSCCAYEDPKILKAGDNGSAVLQVLGVPNFENHKYFHHMRERILDLFQFHPKLLERAETVKGQIFRNDSAPRLCVHTRVGDFVGNGESRREQVGPAIDYAMLMFPRIKKFAANKRFSLLLFGEQREFLSSVKYNKESISEVYYAIDANLTRGEEFGLASVACDAFVITAPLSSFAFWMAYLMPAHRPVFYIHKVVHEVVQLDMLHLLPPEWLPIEEGWLHG